MSQPDPSNRATAHRWTHAGYPVFPCRVDKTPATPRGFYDATTDTAQIDAWWDAMPEALVGMPTGRASGLIALDSDLREGYDGEDALYELERAHGALPNTWVCLTPSGGQHRIFLAPGYPVANSAGKLGQGLDVRGDGGYIIVAGSQLPDGRSYEMEASSPPKPALMPAWLLKALGGSPRPESVQEPRTSDSVPEGGRNHYLASYAGRLAHAGLSVDQVRVALQAENRRACVPPLPDAELERTVLKSTATKWVKLGEDVLDLGELPPPPTIDEFLKMDFPKQYPLLGPFTSQQIVLLHAPTGAGKTLLGLHLAWHMASKRGTFGWKAHAGVPVLYIDGEMSAAMMQERLRDCAGAGDLSMANVLGWAHQHGLAGINLASEEGQAVANRWIEQTNAKVVMLDNLMSLAYVEGVSVNSDEFWTPVRNWAMEQRARNRTIVIIDHSNLTGTVHGTKTKGWHADLVMRIRELPEDDSEEFNAFRSAPPKTRIRLDFTKVRQPVETPSVPPKSGQWDTSIYKERTITLGPVSHEWRWEEGRFGMREKAREMKENGLSIRDISEELNIPKSTIARWVRK